MCTYWSSESAGEDDEMGLSETVGGRHPKVDREGLRCDAHHKEGIRT